MHDAICFARNLHVRACTAAHIHACGLSCEVSHRTVQSGNSFGNSSGIAYISRNQFGNCRDCNSRTMRMRYRCRCRCRCRMPLPLPDAAADAEFKTILLFERHVRYSDTTMSDFRMRPGRAGNPCHRKRSKVSEIVQ